MRHILCLICLMFFSATSAFAEIKVDEDCQVSGCNMELCADKGINTLTACMPAPEHICYKGMGLCKKQADGRCGWEQTAGLKACLKGVSGDNVTKQSPYQKPF